MKNPYQILNVGQDADKKEIQKAQMLAMKEKKYSMQEIAVASKQLLDPAKRLAADFMYPAKIKSRRPQKIEVVIPIEEINITDIDDNAFDSLK